MNDGQFCGPNPQLWIAGPQNSGDRPSFDEIVEMNSLKKSRVYHKNRRTGKIAIDSVFNKSRYRPIRKSENLLFRECNQLPDHPIT
jgi:hypothetical protein